MFLEISPKVHRKTPMPESLFFTKVAGLRPGTLVLIVLKSCQERKQNEVNWHQLTLIVYFVFDYF